MDGMALTFKCLDGSSTNQPIMLCIGLEQVCFARATGREAELCL